MKSQFSQRGSLRIVFKKIINNLKYHHFMTLLITHLIFMLMIKKKFHNVIKALVANNVASHVVINVITNVEVIVRVAALVKMNLANFKQLVIVFIL